MTANIRIMWHSSCEKKSSQTKYSFDINQQAEINLNKPCNTLLPRASCVWSGRTSPGEFDGGWRHQHWQSCSWWVSPAGHLEWPCHPCSGRTCDTKVLAPSTSSPASGMAPQRSRAPHGCHCINKTICSLEDWREATASSCLRCYTILSNFPRRYIWQVLLQTDDYLRYDYNFQVYIQSES